jgi:predicted nucleotide-binding protein (sugar kinase/HSP70/actin superfamily)
MKIGIPRALFYHYYPGLWETFVLALGLEPVLSSPTTTKTIEQASLVSEAEHCLPVKLLDAHIASLVGRADRILVPRLNSMMRGRVSCPKLGALPDAAQANLRGRAEILSRTVDVNREPLDKTLADLGIRLGIVHNRSQQAAQAALAEMNRRRTALSAGRPQDDRPCFLLISHPYILHDEYLIGPIRGKLEEMNIAVNTLPFHEGDQAPDFSSWDTCSRMHQALIDLKPREVAGVIHISSFNCGCDSIMVEFFRELLQEKKIAYLVLVMDEHAAQNGVETRLEAFVDSMRW